MDEHEYIWYTDEKNNIHSAGYLINNIFKKLDMPVLKGNCHPLLGNSERFNNIVIPAGLVSMHSLIKPNENVPITVDGGPASEDLFSQLLSLVKVNDEKPRKSKRKKTRRRTVGSRRKNKSRKK